MNMNNQPLTSKVQDMKERGIIEEYNSFFWKESNQWSFPKEEEITCRTCIGDHGNWKHIILEPQTSYKVCILGCVDCVRNNNWTWGQTRAPTNSNYSSIGSIDNQYVKISSNGKNVNSNEELSDCNLIELMINKFTESEDYYSWGGLYDMLPNRIHLLMSHILGKDTLFSRNEIVEPQYLQFILLYIEDEQTPITPINQVMYNPTNPSNPLSLSLSPLSPWSPWNQLSPEIHRPVSRRLFTDEHENDSKKNCHKALEIIEDISENIPEGKYIELVNIISEIHKRQ